MISRISRARRSVPRPPLPAGAARVPSPPSPPRAPTGTPRPTPSRPSTTPGPRARSRISDRIPRDAQRRTILQTTIRREPYPHAHSQFDSPFNPAAGGRMLKRMLWVLLALALPFGVPNANAQQREVTGTVTGPNGEAIGGAAVSVAGTNPRGA